MAQYAVIGLGAFGRKVALTLTDKGADVIVIDKDHDRIEEIKDQVSAALVLDSTDELAMKASDIDNVDAVVVALGDRQEDAILTTALLKKMGISNIVARAIDKQYGEILMTVGAHRVIIIEEQMGEDLAKRLLSPKIYQHVVLTTGHSLVEIEVKPEFIGKTLKEIEFRHKYGLNVIAIQHKVPKIDDSGKVQITIEVNDIPGPNDRIREGDVLVVVGADENIEKMSLEIKKK